MKPRVLAFRPRERIPESLEQAATVDVSLKVIPLVVAEPHPGAPVRHLIQALIHGHVDYAVFSSPTALRYLRASSPVAEEELRALLARPRLVAIGSRTAEELEEFGLRPEVPEEFSSGGLLTHLRREGVREKGIVLLRSDQGSPDLVHGLRAEGARVRNVALYDLRGTEDRDAWTEVKHAVLGGRFDGYAFTSSLTVRTFFRIFEEDGVVAVAQNELRAKVVGAIGKPTARSLADQGVEAVQPARASFRDLLALLRDRILKKAL